MTPRLSRKPSLYLLLPLLLGIAYAAQHHFIQDDAYLSFVYARHLAEGEGLVWYPGSDEYGYTNFLHTLLVGLMMAAGLGPETAAMLMSFPSFIAALWLTYALSGLVHRERPAAERGILGFCAAAALAVNYSFTAFATGGMETMAVTMLALLVLYQSARLCFLQERLPPLLLSAPASLALLLRLDSVILLLPSALLILDFYAKGKPLPFAGGRDFRIFVLRAATLPLLAVAGVLAFGWIYYGSPLPNTFYVKMPGEGENLARSGLDYLRYYAKYQAYVPLMLVVCVLYLRFSNMGAGRNLSFLLAPLLLWLCYVVYVGGDFMEFRFLVPVLPYFYLYVVAQLAGPDALDRMRKIMLAVFLFATAASNLYHDRVFSRSPLNFSARNLDRLLEWPEYNWKQAGRALNDLFYTGGADDVVIASKAAGAIPYFSRLRTVDQYGLNDRWVARFGQPVENAIAGHRKVATLSYLRERGVNLVLDHPEFICNGKVEIRKQPMLRNVPMLLIPTSETCYLVAYYLMPHPRVVELLQSQRIFELNRINDQ